MYSRRYVPAVALMTLVLAACGDGSANSQEDHQATPGNDQAVKALIKRTMDNLVFVEGGSFQMGDFGPIDPKAEGLPYSADMDNKPLHEVTLDSFSISAYQVSYADYDVYTEATGQEMINTEGWEGDFRAPDVPAGVDWYQARDYCQWLGDQTGLPFALPTEAQWEYAARSRGEFYPFSTFDGRFVERGKNFPTREEIRNSTPADNNLSAYTIGLYPPNPLGIYQMGLNGFEWTNDWYDENYYENSPKYNPTGPESGEKKVRRGASFGETGRSMLTVSRRSARPDLSIDDPRGLRTHSGVGSNTVRCTVNLPDPL